MKRILINTAVCVGVATAMVACSDDNPWSGPADQGGIRLSVEADVTVMGGAASRASTDDRGVVAPESSDFKVRLSKTDGSLSKTFSSLEEFAKEESFPIGDYKIEAFYGQERDFGFEKPYFHGEELVKVKPGSVAEVSVTSALANAMVSVAYTQEFESLYPTRQASVGCGADRVAIVAGDARYAYVRPGTLDLTLSLTNQDGKSVTLNPASFTAQAKHQYNITFGVNNTSAGNSLQLTVVFDDEVDAETVEIDLSDDVFNAAAPTVSPQGFESGQTITLLEGETLPAGMTFNVMAMGNIAGAHLNVISEGTRNNYVAPWGESIDLTKATDAQQAAMAAAGVEARGFFRNPDKMAVLNLTQYFKTLPKGTHTVSMSVTDSFGRISEPVSLTAVVSELTVEAAIPEPPFFQGDVMTVDISSNSSAVKDRITFEVSDKDGAMKKAEILSVEDLSTRSSMPYTFRYNVAMEVNNTQKVDVRVSCGGQAMKTFTVTKVVPDYDVESDAYANYLAVKVTPKNASDMGAIVNNLGVMIAGEDVADSRISRDPSAGMIYVGGLTSATSYSDVKVAIGGSKGNEAKTIPPFATEAQLDLTNGTFDAVSTTVNINPVQVGGQYKVSPTYYTIKSSIVRSEANGWASLNALTCYEGSSNKNTWFLVPSTYVEDGKAVVRSVAYDHSGTTPSTSGGAFNTTYYCENAPATIASRAAGELFLGSYTYNGSASRSDGIAFTSRPSALSFDYTYVAQGSDAGLAYVRLLDASGAVISQVEKQLGSTSSDTRVTLPLPAAFGKKAAKILVGFKSSTAETPAVNIPSGSALNEGLGLGNKTKAANDYKAFAAGSVLTVDNVALTYDMPAAKSKLNKKAKR